MILPQIVLILGKKFAKKEARYYGSPDTNFWKISGRPGKKMKTLSGRKGNRPLPLPGVLKFRTNILRIRRICESGSLRTPNIYAHIFNLVVLAADWEPVESWLGRVRAPADCNWPPANPALSRHIQLYILWHSYLTFSTSQKTLTKDWRFNNAWMMLE